MAEQRGCLSRSWGPTTSPSMPTGNPRSTPEPAPSQDAFVLPKLLTTCPEVKCTSSKLKKGQGAIKALLKYLETAECSPGSAMASVPPKRKRNSRATRQGHHQQQARSLSADRGKPRENLSPTSEAELDKARPCKSRMCGKAHPQGKHPEELIREVPMASGPYFYISGSNGAGLVSIYCQSRGWQRIYDNRRQDYALKWCEIKCRETYYHFKEGEQLLYQIPNNSILTSKTGLLSCLREQERVMKKINRSSNPKLLKMEEFFPESFRLDLKEERNAFFEHCKEEEIWICKPSCSNQGRGIFLLKNPSAVTTLQAKLYSSERDLPSKRVPCGAPQTRIVQRYIDQPLLLEGKKFDVRSYLLIACTAPYVLFFAQGYVRLTCSNYDATSDDLTVHLTNQYMQKKNSLYSQLKDETVWGMEHFNSYINEKFGKTNSLPQDWVFTVFTKRMKQIMLQCFLAAKHKLDRKLGYFDLIGCDFLIDENFKVWLLEMNANPALHTNCKVLRDIIPSIIYESLDLVLEIFTKCLKGQSVLPLKTLCHFVLLYNEDAADLGQKQPWKLSTRLCTGRYLRPHTDSTGHIRKWSISDGQSEGSLQPKDPAIPTETEGAEALWGRTQEELLNLLIAQPIAGWEGRNILSLGEIVWSSWVFLRSYHMEEMSERYLVLTSFHLLILSVDHTKKAFVYEGLVPLAGMHLREVLTAISCTFEITGPMIESRLICCQNSADFDRWIQHLQDQIKMANANYSTSPTSNISFLVPCDEQWKKRELMRHLLCNTILKWEGKPIQHLGRIQYLTMVQTATGCTGDPKERLLILFPEDLLFLSVDEERTTVTYEGKLPLAGIQAKEKSTVLGRLQLEITGSLTEPILINCSTAEDYEKLLFHLQKPEKNPDTVTLQPPPIIPKKSWQYHQDVGIH